MGFEDIKLPNFVVADLYKNNLIEGEKKQVVLPTVTESKLLNPTTVAATETNDNSTMPIKFLGENKKNVVVVIRDDESVFMNDDKLQLLTNLLSACKLTIADVAIINTANQNVNYKQIKQDFLPANLLLMGNVTKKIALTFLFPEYKIQNYDNCQMLITADLQAMLGKSEAVVAEKRKLWESLKLMFKL